ncbi:ABC transporter substrate-binding protein, partial [Paenibacillus yanchengensis]
MKHTKKLITLLMATMLLLAACSSGGGNGGNKTNGGNAGTNGGNAETPAATDKAPDASKTDKITIWAWDPSFNIAALEMAKEHYKKENAELEVEVVESAQNDIVSKLNTTLSSNSTKGLPNIVLIEDYRAQSFLQAYPDAFYPLNDVFNA